MPKVKHVNQKLNRKINPNYGTFIGNACILLNAINQIKPFHVQW